MKTLTLIRHAKSDWGHEGLKDVDRPLSQRGYEDAYILSKWLKDHYPVPQLIVTSPAIRNLSTSFIFARALGYPQDRVQINPLIYECLDKTLMQVIRDLDDACSDIILFAHNAAITHVCNGLTSDLDFENIPTCGIVRLQFEASSWKQVKANSGQTVAHQFPKSFKQGE